MQLNVTLKFSPVLNHLLLCMCSFLTTFTFHQFYTVASVRFYMFSQFLCIV